MKRKLSLALALAMLLTLFAACGNGTVPGALTTGSPSSGESTSPAPLSLTDSGAPHYAEDYHEIYKALEYKGSYSDGSIILEAAVNAEPEEAPVPDAPMVAPADDSAASEGDWSETNTQVAGVDEGDIVKTDGKYIYVLHDLELIIFSAEGKDTHELGRIEIGFSDYSIEKDTDVYLYNEYNSDKRPSELYISENTAVVVSQKNSNSFIQPLSGGVSYDYSNSVCVDFVDISDPASPKKLGDAGQSGYSTASRLLDGKLYIVSSWYARDIDEDEPGTYIPSTEVDGEVSLLPAAQIAVMPEKASSSYSVIGVYNIESNTLDKAESVLGAGDIIYMNTENLYIASSEYYSDESEPYSDGVYTVVDCVDSNRTRITKYSLSGGSVALSAYGEVPGYLDNQFSMDEYGGFLRVVTSGSENRYSIYTDERMGFTNYVWGDNSRANHLFVLGGDMAVVGSVENLAKDEMVYSVRFDGEIGYFVTFRQTDPLFAVDLSTPTQPKVLGQLKIPGFSEYLHVWDEGRLFGLGMAADENTGISSCMKLSMFDTSNPADVCELCTLPLEDLYWSEALHNHKAILISPDKNLIGFPAESSYLFFSYSDGEGFSKKASIDCGGWGYDSRGLYIDDFAYIIGTEAITVLDLSEMSFAATIPI